MAKILAVKLPRQLESLDTADKVEPLRAISGYKLHALTGDLKGSFSIWVTGNYRLIFRFEDGDVYDLNFIDYH